MKLPTWLWIVIALVAVYAAWRLMGTKTAQSWGPIRIAYNKIGDAVDATGVPFNWTNPGR